MKGTLIIAVIAIICVTIITVAAVAMGHNSAIISTAIASIVGAAAGVGAYSQSKSRYPQWHEARVLKETPEDKKGG